MSGVDPGKKSPPGVEVVVSSKTVGKLEIWLDDLTTGKLIATITVSATGNENNWKPFRKAVKNISGHHDLFVNFFPGSSQQVFIKSVRFLKTN